jgi:putative oxidoreductase
VFGNRYLILIFRMVLAATFLVSSFGKFVDIERYSVAMVYNFNILPGPLAIAFGWALPFIELLCALGLLFGILTRLSSLGLGLLGISFLITKAVFLLQGIDIECGCFGAIGSTMASWSIYLDPAISLFSLCILLSSQDSRHWVSAANRLSVEWKDKLNLIW